MALVALLGWEEPQAGSYLVKRRYIISELGRGGGAGDGIDALIPRSKKLYDRHGSDIPVGQVQ